MKTLSRKQHPILMTHADIAKLQRTYGGSLPKRSPLSDLEPLEFAQACRNLYPPEPRVLTAAEAAEWGPSLPRFTPTDLRTSWHVDPEGTVVEPGQRDGDVA